MPRALAFLILPLHGQFPVVVRIIMMSLLMTTYVNSIVIWERFFIWSCWIQRAAETEILTKFPYGGKLSYRFRVAFSCLAVHLWYMLITLLETVGLDTNTWISHQVIKYLHETICLAMSTCCLSNTSSS